MDRLGVRELRINTSAAIRRAGAGERIVITVDGRPVAQLGPLEPTSPEVTLDDLVARGLLIAPRRPDRPEPTLAVQPWAGIRLDRTLREIR
ncbi:MAG: type II toxin-antitoxin system Phd/YefM family antitoxin [Acidimicrobiia bacterium]